MANKQHLGDGYYVKFNGCTVALTREKGVSVTNRIVLQPDVYNRLVKYVELLKARAAGAITHPQ